jgi:hypothetical protein
MKWGLQTSEVDAHLRQSALDCQGLRLLTIVELRGSRLLWNNLIVGSQCWAPMWQSKTALLTRHSRLGSYRKIGLSRKNDLG